MPLNRAWKNPWNLYCIPIFAFHYLFMTMARLGFVTPAITLKFRRRICLVMLQRVENKYILESFEMKGLMLTRGESFFIKTMPYSRATKKCLFGILQIILRHYFVYLGLSILHSTLQFDISTGFYASSSAKIRNWVFYQSIHQEIQQQDPKINYQKSFSIFRGQRSSSFHY